MKKRLAILALVLLTLAGCRASLRRPPVTAKVPPEQILSQLKARQQTLTAFEARGRLTLLSPEQNATGAATLKGKLPETLKVDIRDPLGRAVLNFYTDGQVVEILFPRENKLLQGPATPTNLAAFVPPGVKVNQALRLLVGDLPLSQGPPGRISSEPGEKAHVLEWVKTDGSLQERLWVSADEAQPRKVEWYGVDGQLAFSAELGEFGRLAPGRPQQVKLVTANPRVELRFAFRDFTPKPSLSPADLAVPRPAGVMVQPLKP